MSRFPFRFLLVALFAGFCAAGARAGAITSACAVSTNTFGTLRVEVATTNTMIAVPWTWHSIKPEDALHLPVKKLVKTENLEVGDMLYTPAGQKVYAAWILETNVVQVAVTNGVPVVQTNFEWSAVQVVDVPREGFGSISFAVGADNDANYYTNATRIARGNGLWLHRQKPLDETGAIRPFWLYGQCVTNAVTTEIPAPTDGATVVSTVLGNPFSQDVMLNSLQFNGVINSGDRIKIYTTTGAMRDLIYVQGKGWREYATKIVNGKLVSGYTYRTMIPAGTSFWYDRRGTDDFSITWPAPSGN